MLSCLQYRSAGRGGGIIVESLLATICSAGRTHIEARACARPQKEHLAKVRWIGPCYGLVDQVTGMPYAWDP